MDLVHIAFQGETIPDSGIVYKHPALRVGYVSQHATHHIGALAQPVSIGILISIDARRAASRKDARPIYPMAIPGRT